MAQPHDLDAIIIGSGPNGLAAAVRLAQAGLKVRVYEGRETIGGGARTAELTLPGFRHDICSAIHPLGISSPFFSTLPLQEHGLEYIQPEYAVAHPFDDGSAAILHRDLDITAEALGADGRAWKRLMGPVVAEWDRIAQTFLGPLRIPPLGSIPALVNFGLRALSPASTLARLAFSTEQARGLFAGIAAHAILPLEKAPSAAFGMVLGAVGHVAGWPIPRGGSQAIIDALASCLRSMGGEIVTGQEVRSLDELPPARLTFFNTAPVNMATIAGERLSAGYRQQLQRFRHGPGSFKIDWALSGPVPWTAEACRKAGTIHLGPTLDAIAASERAMWNGQHTDRPYVLIAQQSLFDDTRAPEGQHTLWGYCHVPAGSTVDMTEVIEDQVERFAPGFKELILARHTITAQAFEAYNPNYIAGDIAGGIVDFRQLFTRPSIRLEPYRTSAPDIFICSASTPPGGGVHGMAGYHAAEIALRELRT